MAPHASSTYDAFLSAWVEDTDFGFIPHLINALRNENINIFKYDEAFKDSNHSHKAGKAPTLPMEIDKSKYAVIVLSPNYASSTWCLDELTKIAESMEDKNQTVHPIFYKVDPSDLRDQRGKFSEAISKHQEEVGLVKIRRWTAALDKVANLSGTETKNSQSDQRKLIKDITENVKRSFLLQRRHHDVFLSFMCRDIRGDLISNLTAELSKRGVRKVMYRKDESEGGKDISPHVLNSIEESSCAVVVLSKNYASSTWCLSELAKIWLCMEDKKIIVIPIFYHVDPSKVKNQRESFAEAFSKHEEQFRQHGDLEKVNKWRAALTKVASLYGWDTNNYRLQRQLVKNIAEFVSSKLFFRGKHDVFLSFRCEDTPQAFISQLYHDLLNMGVKPFLDDKKHETGTAISPNVLTKIEESKSAIVVMSANYISSAPCMEELTKISQCMEEKNIIVAPIFYHIDPSDVRNQRGSFAEGFMKHEEQCTQKDVPKVQQWRAALTKIAHLSGWDTQNYENKSKLLKRVAEFVSSQILFPGKHDVFLSFRGEEALKGFISHLYHELQNSGVKTFMHDEALEGGTFVSLNIEKEIEESRFALIVLSQNYVYSKCCLDELAQIFRCMEDRRRIWLLRYEVDRIHLRNQVGPFNVELLEKSWKAESRYISVVHCLDAFNKVVELSGSNTWDTENYESETHLVFDIVEFFKRKVRPIESKHTNSMSIDGSEAVDQITIQAIADIDPTMSMLAEHFQTSQGTITEDDPTVLFSTEVLETVDQVLVDNEPIMSTLAGDYETTCQVGITEDQPTLSKSNDDFEVVNLPQVLQDSIPQDEPKLSNSTEDVDAIDQAIVETNTTIMFEDIETSQGAIVTTVAGPTLSKLAEASLEDEPTPLNPTEDVEAIDQAIVETEPAMMFEDMETSSKGTMVNIASEPTLSKLAETIPEDLQAIDQAIVETEPTIMPKNIETSQGTTVTIATEPTLSKLLVEGANQTSEPAPQWKYDVFLSFRGEDTRTSIVSHLYDELQKSGVIKVFMDNQLEKGKDIEQSLLTAIEESRFALIVLSKNYAASRWCLDELAKICQCMDSDGRILPIFYHVEATDVRYQTNSFGEAFKKLMLNYDTEKVKNWRTSLNRVSNHAGWDLKNYKNERELVKGIVNDVFCKVLQVPQEEFQEFEATRQAMDDLMQLLKDDKNSVIGVCGKGGAGKTTMVKYVSKKAKRNGLFDQVVMVVISRSPVLTQIQDTLARQLGLELVEESQNARASRLKEKIMERSRILVILDDIWDITVFSSIGIPDHSELQRGNSKVILTTRIKDDWHSMGCQAQVILNVLSAADSYKLFMKKLRKSCSESTDSSEVRMVVGECNGLPYALKAAARAFGYRYLKEQKKAVAMAFRDDNLDEYKNGAVLYENERDKDSYSIKSSYYSLKSDDAKSCFLLCSLFPEDQDIPIQLLLKYGIGNGLFHCTNTLQEARDRLHSVVQHLKASGLLWDVSTRKGYVKMRGDIRHVAKSLMLSEGLSAISLMQNELVEIPKNLVCSKLQILLLQGNPNIRDFPENLIELIHSPTALRVLDLSHTRISSLPSSLFSLLVNLGALFLDRCPSIIDISVLGELKKLQILSMRNLLLKEFPKQIQHLTNLRMLDVTGGRFHTIPSEVISRLHLLEELYMKCGFGEWGSKVEDAVEETNANFEELIGLSFLKILSVNISDAEYLPKSVECFNLYWAQFDICIGRDVPRKKRFSHIDKSLARILTLNTTIDSLSDWFNKVVTGRAEKLMYHDCMGLTDILVEYDRGRLEGLKYLSVDGGNENLAQLINAVKRDPNKPIFESLEELHLLSLQYLEKLCVGELPPGSLCKLKLLKVQTCRNLVNTLLQLNLLHRLLNLETVICVNMEQMRYVFGFEGLEPDSIVLEKLREIRLCALPELKSIWNGPAPHVVFQNLKILAVCECKELKNLFPLNVAQLLVQLEDLCVEHCPSLDRVIEESNFLNSRTVLSKLKKLALISLPELSWFCTENGTINTEFPSLEYLCVDKCPKFSYPHSPSVKINDRQHLDSIVNRWKEMHTL